MTSLPDRPDLDQLRSQAKELKRALVAGDQVAIDRVLANHPKYTGRPPERAEARYFTLRDAQVTIARELKFDSWKELLGWSQGIAIGLGHAELRDEHTLLAMLYSDLDRLSFFIDHDEILEGLGRRGVPTPSVLPPVPPTPSGPFGPYVYLNSEQLSLVTKEVAKRYPTGTVLWGMNKSKWKRDHWYIHGEDEIPMQEIVRSALPEGAETEILSNEEGNKLENADAPRRYRDPTKKESS